jgi:hypothetical protein
MSKKDKIADQIAKDMAEATTGFIQPSDDRRAEVMEHLSTAAQAQNIANYYITDSSTSEDIAAGKMVVQMLLKFKPVNSERN